MALPIIDDAFRVTDKEAVAMSRYLVLNDGLFLGSSSACNLVACIRLAKKMGWKEGQRLVTILYAFGIDVLLFIHLSLTLFMTDAILELGITLK